MKRTVRGLGAAIGVDTAPVISVTAGQPPAPANLMPDGLQRAGAICLIPGILTRWVALYTMPLIVGAAQFWLVRKGFFFTGAGAELPTLWAVALIVQAGLGDGAFALVRSPAFPFIGSHHRAMPAE